MGVLFVCQISRLGFILTDMEQVTPYANTLRKKSLYWSAGLSLYAVIFLWGFWESGLFALGINAALFLLGLLFACRGLLPGRALFIKKNLVWAIPFVLIAISYALYENPFIKMVNYLAIPVSALVFLAYALHPRLKTFLWDSAFFAHLAERAGYMISAAPAAIKYCVDALAPSRSLQKSKVKRISAGVLLLAIIALTIVLPLLGSANPAFSALSNSFYAWLGTVIGPELFGRVIMFIVVLVLILAMLFSWQKPVKDAGQGGGKHPVDPIISGIVLAGVLVIYLLFLSFELGRLWISSLPIDFQETEHLVKSGFWQLLALTALNIIFFFGCYRRTNRIVQRLLIAFTGASFLLLASAAWRMGMYVFFYGASYEKFYAAYTVVFCGILLLWLFSRLFATKAADLIKGAVFLLLWMYAVIAIMPAEQIIFTSNVTLAARAGSRIVLSELTMLSPAVLGPVQTMSRANPETFKGWEQWEERSQGIVNNKPWYELNLENMLYLAGH